MVPKVLANCMKTTRPPLQLHYQLITLASCANWGSVCLFVSFLVSIIWKSTLRKSCWGLLISKVFILCHIQENFIHKMWQPSCLYHAYCYQVPNSKTFTAKLKITNTVWYILVYKRKNYSQNVHLAYWLSFGGSLRELAWMLPTCSIPELAKEVAADVSNIPAQNAMLETEFHYFSEFCL